MRDGAIIQGNGPRMTGLYLDSSLFNVSLNMIGPNVVVRIGPIFFPLTATLGVDQHEKRE